MLTADHVAIVGSGFSGTLLAINLLRHGTGRVTLIERAPSRLARGLAYGQAQADHVLNVRAANMSAFPDLPHHFVDWLDRHGLGSDASFATRRNYGAYLAELFEATKTSAAARLAILTDEATVLSVGPKRTEIALRSGQRLVSDVAVLAPGNLPQHTPAPFAALDRPLYIDDPWVGDLAADLGPDDEVLLLGNGLTAVDCALTLASAGFRGRMTALSRRGLSPQSHAPQSPPVPSPERPGGTASDLVRAVRRRAAEIGWRGAVDELRPHTQLIWRAADDTTRRRFLRHLRPFWDVHRHRLAPEIAGRIEALRTEGRLDITAGKIIAAEPEGDRLRVTWRPRGTDETVERRFARVVNCTGPLGDLSRTTDPLLADLRDTGLIRADTLAIGIDVDQQNRAIAGNGRSHQRMFVVGPMTRGAHWEIVAVPDIRRQVWDLARYLCNAHWVTAEGL